MFSFFCVVLLVISSKHETQNTYEYQHSWKHNTVYVEKSLCVLCVEKIKSCELRDGFWFRVCCRSVSPFLSFIIITTYIYMWHFWILLLSSCNSLHYKYSHVFFLTQRERRCRTMLSVLVRFLRVCGTFICAWLFYIHWCVCVCLVNICLCVNVSLSRPQI